MLISTQVTLGALGDSSITRPLYAGQQPGVGSIIKVDANKVTQFMTGVGFETTLGTQYSITDVIGANPYRNSALKKILQMPVIELKSGEILYREEIQFGLIKLQQVSSGFGGLGILEKAPHTPD